MGRHIIVDGYNLALSGALLLPADPTGPEGRDFLCALASAYARAKGFRLTVVFDGGEAAAASRTRQPFKGGTSIFSGRSETADDVIRDLARSAPSGTVVVTSDRGLCGTLSGRNLTVVSCAEFGERLGAFQLEGIKGATDEGGGRGESKPKKGEGKRRKKRERERDRLLRKL